MQRLTERKGGLVKYRKNGELLSAVDMDSFDTYKVLQRLAKYEDDAKLLKETNIKTYGDIFANFLTEFNIDREKIADYRPAAPPYIDCAIPYGIIIWFKSGTITIYISKNERV